MGISTLLSMQNVTSATASIAFTSGLDSTYDEYMFVCTNVETSGDGHYFSFQVNASDDEDGDYDTSLITSTFFQSSHAEGDGSSGLAYGTSWDLTQSASLQHITSDIDGDADSCCDGILHLFNPASTTYVKHFYSRFVTVYNSEAAYDCFCGGYINDTTAITQIRFKFDANNINNATIQMYGIA